MRRRGRRESGSGVKGNKERSDEEVRGNDICSATQAGKKWVIKLGCAAQRQIGGEPTKTEKGRSVRER